jgi:signal peptidase II
VLLVVIVVSTIGCDQVAKHVARTELAGGRSFALLGGVVRFALAENAGGFLSLGASLPDALRAAVFRYVAAAGLLVAVGFLISRSRLSPVAFLSASFACAGGLSNLIDRALRDGQVTDFMQAGIGRLHTGVFNVADVAITVGCVLFALSIRGIEAETRDERRRE